MRRQHVLPSSVTMPMVWRVMLLSAWSMSSLAFTAPPPLPSWGFYSHSYSRTHWSQCFSKDPSSSSDEEAVLSDVDARVLQEMLQQDKLDAQQTENMQKLLERGIKSKEPVRQDQEEEEEDSDFQSSVLKTLSNTKLWKALRRNAQDVLESAKIYVENRVERDAKLLGALGLFAFERAILDVGRALPAASTVTKKVVLQISNVTGATSPTQQRLLLLSNATSAPRNAIRDGMRTPEDEVKLLKQDIEEIFQRGGDTTFRMNAASERRRLRSVSERAGKERFQKALKRRQATTLKQEQENPFQKSSRAVSGVVDMASELQRELEVEQNQAGYRTKAIREGAVSTGNLLRESATKILSAAKRQDKNLLSSEASAETLPIETEAVPLVSDEATVVDATFTSFGVASPADASTYNDMEDRVMDATAAAFAAAGLGGSASSPDVTIDAELVEPVIEAPIAESSTDNVSVDRITTIPNDYFFTTAPSPEVELQTRIRKELDEIVEMLDRCVEYPDQTWLQSDQIAEDLESLNAKTLEPIIASMVVAKQTLELSQREIRNPSTRSLYDSLVVAKELLVPIIQSASVKNIDYALETQLIYLGSRSSDPMVLNLKSIKSQVDRFDPGKATSETSSYVQASREVAAEVAEVLKGPERTIEPQIVDVETELSPFESSVIIDNDDEADYEDNLEDLRSVSAEIISDDDFDDALNQAKTVYEYEEDDEAEEESKPNPVVTLSLRALDVVLFVVEKTFTVVLPTIANAGGLAASRLAKVQSEGLGSRGWSSLKSAKKAEKRY